MEGDANWTWCLKVQSRDFQVFPGRCTYVTYAPWKHDIPRWKASEKRRSRLHYENYPREKRFPELFLLKAAVQVLQKIRLASRNTDVCPSCFITQQESRCLIMTAEERRDVKILSGSSSNCSQRETAYNFVSCMKMIKLYLGWNHLAET